MEQLAQLQARRFQRVRVMAPIAPARSNGQNRGVHEGDLPHVFENLRVLVILNAVADGLKPYPRCGLAGGDWTRRVEENSITRSAEPAATSGGIHIVPTADSVTGGPSIGAVVKDSRRALRPIQESSLDALVDRRIVHHPLRSVAESGVATCIAPEIAMGKRQRGPLLQGIEQHPMVDRTV